MDNEHAIIDAINNLSNEQKTTIDNEIESLVNELNQNEIQSLIEESMLALTAGSKLNNDLQAQNTLQNFWNRVNGNNARNQEQINAHLIEAQYAAQQLLNKLEERNLFNLQLILAVNNKLNQSINQVDNQLINISETLKTFAQKVADRLRYQEIKMDLLDWVQNINNRKFNGDYYSTLSDSTKIVCVVRDFFDLTKDFQNHENIFKNLLTASDNLGLTETKTVNVYDFIHEVCQDDNLYNHLFNEKVHFDIFATEDKQISFELRKFKLNGASQNTPKIEKNARCIVSKLFDEICRLYRAKIFHDKFQSAQNNFFEGKIETSVPLLQELINASNELSTYEKILSPARYMLATVYNGNFCVEKNPEYVKKLLKENVQAGDISSIFFAKRLSLDFVNDTSLDDKISELKSLADKNDGFARYELALNYFKTNIQGSYKYFQNSSHPLAIEYLGHVYWEGGNDTQHRKIALKFYNQAYAKGISSDNLINNLGMYYHEIGNYEEALRWWKIGEEKGYPACIESLGTLYMYGRVVNQDYSTAVEYFKKAVEAGSSSGYPEYYLGTIYKTVYNDLSKARSFFQKSADKGNIDAKKFI